MIPLICVTILGFAAAFHFYWGFGGQVGLRASVPQREDGVPLFKPDALGAFGVAFALIIAALFVLAHMGFISLPLPAAVPEVVVKLLAAIFLVRAFGWFKYAGFFKQVRNTTFGKYDTWLYCPLCQILGLGLVYVSSPL